MDSDVDLLVDMDPERSLLDHVALLQDLLGVDVAVATKGALRWYLREGIVREATPL